VELSVYEVIQHWRYFVIAANEAEALTHAASRRGESYEAFLQREPSARVLDEEDRVPFRDGAEEFEMLSPSEVIKRRINSGVVFFGPLGDQ
jgi:hypothetical protein